MQRTKCSRPRPRTIFEAESEAEDKILASRPACPLLVYPSLYKSVDEWIECRRRLPVEHLPNMSESTKMKKASHTDRRRGRDMLVEDEVGRDDNSKHSGVLLWSDNGS